MTTSVALSLIGTSSTTGDPLQARRPVFVVDDDAVAQRRITEALAGAGLVNPVLSSLNGSDAMTTLRELVRLGTGHIPALVFLDSQLPGCDGIEILRWMRDTPALRTVPVVVVSADDAAQRVLQAYDLGASSYLVKPLAFSVIGATVRSLALPWSMA